MYTPTHTVSLSIMLTNMGHLLLFWVPELRLEVEFSYFSLIYEWMLLYMNEGSCVTIYAE